MAAKAAIGKIAAMNGMQESERLLIHRRNPDLFPRAKREVALDVAASYRHSPFAFAAEGVAPLVSTDSIWNAEIYTSSRIALGAPREN
jgi:hypothetical protein